MKTAFFVSCLFGTLRGVQLEQTVSVYGDLLAQMAVNTDYSACNVVADRNKVGAENLEVMEKQRKKGKFTDPAFPRDINAIFWPSVEDTGEGNLLELQKL